MMQDSQKSNLCILRYRHTYMCVLFHRELWFTAPEYEFPAYYDLISYILKIECILEACFFFFLMKQTVAINGHLYFCWHSSVFHTGDLWYQSMAEISKFLQILISFNDNYSCTQKLLPLVSLTFPQEYKSLRSKGLKKVFFSQHWRNTQLYSFDAAE